MSSKVTVSGQQVNFDAVVGLMDTELREELHSTIEQTVHDASDPMRICTDQEFVDAYAARHSEKFGEDFQVA